MLRQLHRRRRLAPTAGLHAHAIRRVLGRVVLLVIMVASPLSAQRVAGTVRDLTGLDPIPGAVVTLTDSAGRTLRQVMTDARGRFSTQVAAPWVRLRVLRIGFRPDDESVRAASARASSLDIRMQAIAIQLDAVQASTRKICGNEDSGGDAAATVWQQAQAGLLATIVARTALPANSRILRFRQVYDSLGERLLQQRTSVDSGGGQLPFAAAASAQNFARIGFVVDLGDARRFFAPDAAVLLDSRFAENHCFSLTTDPSEHPGEVGLAFQPGENASTNIVDVAGTLWMDGGELQLRSMSFHYVNLEGAAMDAGAGGSLTFSKMANGVVVLSRWSLTAPVLARRMARWGEPPGSHYTVTQVQRIGGVLAQASWPDGVQWRGPVGAVDVQVVRGIAAIPARGVRVWLETTGDTDVTDADGRARFTDVLPGEYTIRERDEALAAFDVEPVVQATVNVREGENSAPPLTLLSYDDIQRGVCSGDRTTQFTAVLMGQLSTDSGPPKWPLDLRLTWPGIGSSSVIERHLSPAADGRFSICGVPRGRVISIQARRDTAVLLDTVVTSPTAPVGMFAFTLKPRGHP
jgi:Carboxypeptidase regulatory-like domain